MSQETQSQKETVARALLSVSDTEGLDTLARSLVQHGWELWATEGTARRLEEWGIPVRHTSEITGQASMLGGRVKSLHPRIFAGVLARPDPADAQEVERAGGVLFDLVVVNFYPFARRMAERRAARDGADSDLIEAIDIGGPALVRAAAKNHARVAVATDPSQYAGLLEEIARAPDHRVSAATRRALAAAAFVLTSRYDALVAGFLAGRPAGVPGQAEASFPEVLRLEAARWLVTRYGENPHQQGAVYRLPTQGASVPWGRVIQGKELSFNNVADAAAALALVRELAESPAACAIKHGTPCGAGVGETLARAYELTAEADPVSIFGGIVALSRPVDEATAQLIARTFLEVIVAPSFEPAALEVLAKKPKLRLIEVGPIAPPGPAPDSSLEIRSIAGGLLVQGADEVDWDDTLLQTVTSVPVPQGLWPDLRFAWRVCKHARSNAIVVAKGGQTLGIGAGQTNRIAAARIALDQAGSGADGAVLASDGFFPFSDVVELAAERQVAAIVQPGGSVRDHESVTAAERAGIPMVFTRVRHFRH